ncbi:MAG: thioredoxin-dependent thiol peroxidase [Spirochaetaceae bacterium]
MAQLNTGDKAPDFTLQDQDGNEISLSDFRGKKVLLYFYPKADTPGCTTQACSVRDSGPALSNNSIKTLGISPDAPKSQKKFDEKYSLGFPLLSDTDHAVAEKYGVWKEKTLAGKTGLGIIRSSFLIDEDGKILDSWYKVKPDETVPKALQAIEKK